ncbi:MAG TPA: transporter substrate-binding domain-containing protein [Hyphomicrobiaceae bacterium]|nr:transporter substrate-binding domain-containing protein [Hyphomicrobiaceae bacterium]
MMSSLADLVRRHAPAFVLTLLAFQQLATAAPAQAEAKPTTLERILERGHVVCGFTRTSPGFSTVDARGQWSGFDVDFCRALAAGILGKAAAVKPLMIAPSAAATALLSGEVDILATGTAISLTRETGLGIRFPGVIYHDATRLLVKRSQGITSARELSGASICVGNNPETIEAIAGFFKSYGLKHEAVVVEKWEEMVQAYVSGRCQALAADAAMLADLRGKLAGSGEHHILPEAMAITMLGPAVRRGDPAWYDVVRWTIHALVAAEQLGITSTRVESLKASTQLDVRRLLGVEGDIGKPLGLPRSWVYQIVKSIGNYGEIYERNLGQRSPFKLERRSNDLWTRGGLMVAPHLR